MFKKHKLRGLQDFFSSLQTIRDKRKILVADSFLEHHLCSWLDENPAFNHSALFGYGNSLRLVGEIVGRTGRTEINIDIEPNSIFWQPGHHEIVFAYKIVSSERTGGAKIAEDIVKEGIGLLGTVFGILGGAAIKKIGSHFAERKLKSVWQTLNYNFVEIGSNSARVKLDSFSLFSEYIEFPISSFKWFPKKLKKLPIAKTCLSDIICIDSMSASREGIIFDVGLTEKANKLAKALSKGTKMMRLLGNSNNPDREN